MDEEKKPQNQEEQEEVEDVGVGPADDQEVEQNQEKQDDQDEENDKIQNQQEGEGEDQEKQDGQEQQQEEVEEEAPKICQRCEKHKQQILEQEQTYEKLQSQNDKLESDLIDLEKVKEEVKQKLKDKEEEKKLKKKDPEEEELKRKIKSENTRFLEFKKKIDENQKKIDNNANYEKAKEIERDQKKVEEEIEVYRKKNLQIDQDRKENEYIIQLRNAEFVQEKKKLEDDLKKQKTILLHVRKNIRDSQIDMVVQQEHLVRLIAVHRDICETYGKSSSMNQTKIDYLGALIEKNYNHKLKQQEEEDKDREEFDLTADNYRAKRQEVQDLFKKKNGQVKDFQERLNTMQIKIDLANQELTKKKNKLKETESNYNLAIMKINELKRTTRHNQLVPLNLEKKVQKGMVVSKSHADGKFLKQVFKLQNEVYQPKVVTCGVGLLPSSAETIKDQDQLPQDVGYRIQKMDFYYFQEVILGIQVVYKTDRGQEINVDTFLPSNIPVDSLEKKSIKFQATEYISTLTGYARKDHIQFIEIITSRGGKLQVGTDRYYQKCRKFVLQMEKDEKPISLQVSIDQLIKGGDNTQFFEEKVLLQIGFEVKKKNVGKQLANSYLRTPFMHSKDRLEPQSKTQTQANSNNRSPSPKQSQKEQESMNQSQVPESINNNNNEDEVKKNEEQDEQQENNENVDKEDAGSNDEEF